MATEVYTTAEVSLQDGTEVEVRPLPISKLRKFMRLWSEYVSRIGDALESENPKTQDELSDDQFNTFIKMCALGLDSIKGDRTDKAFASYLEDVLDQPTIYFILEATGGLKLGDVDPNLSQKGLEAVGMN